MEYIEKIQQERLNLLSAKVIQPLQAFLPQIKSVNISLSNKYRRNSGINRRNLVFNIDDGVLTNLSNKGDGVKSLATIALLSQLSSNTNRLIIIDEPENHLHPEAIRYISNVINELSINNQVIVSTHSPLFINRSNVSSNVIVSKGKTVNASKITDVRDVLGVMCSDNLMYSDYVVVVEGQTDKTLFEKLMLEDSLLKQCLKNNIITVRSIGGTNNLQSEIYALQRYCCNYLVVLDGDSIGKTEANNIRQKLSVPNEQIRFIMVSQKKESELEDLYKQDFYSDYLLNHGIDIQNPAFKKMKWSKRIEEILKISGIELLNEEEDKYKKEISEMIITPVKDYLSSEGYKLLCSILDKIKADLTQMRLL